MAVSLAMLAASYGLRPFMTELWHWYSLSLLAHAAMPGAAVLATGRVVGMWFPRTRGRMMGVTMMGANFGGMTMPVLAGTVISTISWQAGYVAFAILTGIVAVLALILVRDKEIESVEESQKRKTENLVPMRAISSVRDALNTKAFWAITLAITMGNFTFDQ